MRTAAHKVDSPRGWRPTTHKTDTSNLQDFWQLFYSSLLDRPYRYRGSTVLWVVGLVSGRSRVPLFSLVALMGCPVYDTRKWILFCTCKFTKAVDPKWKYCARWKVLYTLVQVQQARTKTKGCKSFKDAEQLKVEPLKFNFALSDVLLTHIQ